MIGPKPEGGPGIQEGLAQRGERGVPIVQVHRHPGTEGPVDLEEAGRAVEAGKAIPEREGEGRSRRQEVSAALFQQGDDPGIDLRPAGDGPRLASWRPVHVNHRAEGIAGHDDPQELDRLNGLGETADPLLLGRSHEIVAHSTHRVEQGGGVPDVGVALRPSVGAEGSGPRVERAGDHLRHVARIGVGVQVESFPAHHAEQHDIAVRLGHVVPEPDQEAGGHGVDRHRGRAGVQFVEAGIVEISNVERIAAARGQRAHQGSGEPEGLGRGSHLSAPHRPRLMVKKKVRLGGYGVTSMFRWIGWLPKLLTSGSNPL